MWPPIFPSLFAVRHGEDAACGAREILSIGGDAVEVDVNVARVERPDGA
jgi:hypothetical protein